MSGAGGARADINIVLGPWPNDAHGEWAPADAERHLDRFGLSFALARSSIAETYDAAEGNRRLLEQLEGHPRLLPAFVLGPLESGEHGDPRTVPADLAEAGVRAVWLLPKRHGWDLVGPGTEALFSVLGRAGLPVLIELDETDWSGIDTLCGAIPEVDVVVTGIGYRTLRQVLPVMDRWPRLHVDLSYTAVLDGLELLTARYGASRLIMGTGAPVRDDAAPWFLLAHSDLDPADAAMVVGGNAARLLGLGSSETAAGTVAAATATGEELPDIVDAHAHLGSWPSSWLPHPGIETLLTAFGRSGTKHAVISHLAAIWGGDAVAGNAAAVAAAQAHPNRLSAYLVANPNRPQDAELLREQLRLPEVRGIKVHPDTHDCPLDDHRYAWIWRLAIAESAPVLAHGFAGTGHSDPYLFGTVADRFGELTLLIGHSGATVEGFRRTIEVGLRHQNLLAETCGSWMTGRWLRRLVAALGPERVLHGTDACLIDPRYGVGRVLGAGLDPADQALVLGGNARRVLGLPAGKNNSKSISAGGH